MNRGIAVSPSASSCTNFVITRGSQAVTRFINPSSWWTKEQLRTSTRHGVTPAQPPRRGTWIELMSVEGKLVFCSHHTGPGGSVEWTVQYFPRREPSYYLAQYPAIPSINPLLELVPSSRPLVVKDSGAIMEELSNYLFSASRDEPEVDATPFPLPLSRLKSSGGPTSMEMIESSSALPLTPRPDSGSEAAIASSSSPKANADANSVEPISPTLSYLRPAFHRRHSCPSLQIDFADALSQQGHSSRRVSIAFEQTPRLYLSKPETSDDPTSIDMIESSDILTATQADSDSETVVGSTIDADSNPVVAGDFPLPRLKPAVRRRHSLPNLRAHATCQQRHSSRRASIAGDQLERLYPFRPESRDDATSIDMMEPSNSLTLTQPESDSENVVGSIADADANSVQTGYFPLPHLKQAARRRHSCPDLRTHFFHAPSRQVHSPRRVSIAVELRPYLTRPRHAREVANSAEEDGDYIKEEGKFKFRRGGKRNTARKHRRQMQEQDQGNPGAGPSSAN